MADAAPSSDDGEHPVRPGSAAESVPSGDRPATSGTTPATSAASDATSDATVAPAAATNDDTISPDPASDGDPALARLAALYGIEPSFTDANGTPVRASDETRRALLAAMGADLSDPEAAARALAETAADRLISPVLVLRPEGGRITVPVGATGSVRYRIDLERGGTVEAETRVESGAIRLEDPGFGYHSIKLEAGDEIGRALLVVTPGACWLPDGVTDGRRLWGVSVQLYLLRSEENWGIGDYGDLVRLVEVLAAEGCAVVGLNPLHAQFVDDPEQASPYSPASRLLLNILNIAVPRLPEAADPDVAAWIASDDVQARIAAARDAALVDYTLVAALKTEALQRCHQVFQARADAARSAAFERFRSNGGDRFELSCLFLALRDHFARTATLPDWHDWPDAFKDPASDAVLRFAVEHRDAIDFVAWCQWLADVQLAEADAAARDGGMAIGLYRDLAVGADRAGAETWANPAAVIDGVSVGAPPDLFNPAGQSWGLPPFHPRQLRQEGYQSFVDLIRANMRHAGGLRIDHVMGLQQLYCIPAGATAADGAYLAYPVDDLLGVLALESLRHRCLVVGEDLGTVPEGFREKMEAGHVLSYRVLAFEKDEETGGFAGTDAYPVLSVAVAASHDLATLKGWWQARDVAAKDRLGLYADEAEATAQRALRDRERRDLATLLHREKLLATEGPIRVESFVDAAHRHLARTRSALAVVQLDDITGERDQVNIPATDRETPNWRRKYGATVEALAANGAFEKIGRIMDERDGRAGAADRRPSSNAHAESE
ncbi:4-alpha-glucanotransferase [Mongoliimonas terrestris]|uniref:4-alpha-glucanotransferase n=1 Tax=Mongoliimonas terrestris TaxID=1709001 RepID=UPI000949A991|nr:4-alpha-glucanotransferase [Mongoliimonas terrestris]